MMQRKLALLVGITTFTLLLVLRWEHVIRLVSLMRSEIPSAESEPQTDQPSAEPTLPPWQRAPTETITPIPGSRHLMVSAFKDHRRGGVIRVISIICRQELQPLYCVLCANDDANTHANANASPNAKANGRCMTSQAKVDIHSDHFGFPFHTSDVFCTTTTSQQALYEQASYVSITSDPNTTDNMTFLTIQNHEIKESFKYKFTICISNLFGGYNNALQFAQTMEVYKLIGVQRVVIYNTSCGPDVEKVLRYYSREGMLEVVPWPIDKFLTPSTGWRYDLHHGDIHYYGQLATLNECIYRYMYQSKYLLLNDIDEIIMPYKHGKLEKLMDTLQQQHPNAGVFRIENHIFPKTQFEDTGRFRLPQWRRVPGVNILEHIYREPDRKNVFNPTKLLIDPRRVERTSVHSTLNQFGPVVIVPFDVCRIIHVRAPLQGHLAKDQLLVDKKLWEFEKRLIPSIDNALNQSGL
ncbi:glycosyltransferase family 92 protein F13G3.3-like [Alosa sapidissima]|uniref:glycosyltransferase family 92 protein F13G3.3-like n=1 Tax=Alosa sapidissima TaxID=34773 RepID=UPI001C09E1FE|nr:glycosyltransferase family 92 protein F13G3.3-like [Alosa sapidissima]XP_041958289.1 glycosyltransferase family 92 protein F13G3.3-like [Alosa sapidissima]XP_041958290.1 glycosyltransferase family 92 protein F13G3.3-like [Alosa sapidissima]XP_041958291.1 glycosyltransferase family 92 protein F13G3.3-like [Alosa sapidissima]XP_041958292.1 glycosyltransferase family 92 protein F13G3.3-like [Alosa sapidissima]XP_041958293.1 glycosyltransferase family 92 protein F13G3.3-like [Alosa sapidissima]